MYLQPWQVFALGCVIGTFIAIVVLSIIIVQIIGRAGVHFIEYQQPQPPQRDPSVDLISKLCFILLARQLIDEVDNDFMLDKVAFNDWKNHIDDIIANKEKKENGDNRDQQRDTEENNNM